MNSHLPLSETASDASMLLFEVLERAVRLYSHVDRSCRAAARPGARSTAQLKIAKEAQQLVLTHIEWILSTFTKAQNEAARIAGLHMGLNRLALIHSRVLVAVPRPHEPIELVSYLRQTLFDNETIEPNRLDRVPEVFASEALGDQAHDRYLYLNPVAGSLDFEAAQAISGNITEFAERQLGVSASDEDTGPTNIGYVSLPRIDLGNPCRWPSLLHEVGHFFYDADDVWQKFKEWLGEERLKTVLSLISEYAFSDDSGSRESELKAWLQECWCDSFAITRAGPAVFFAQMHAFLFCTPCYLTEASKRGAKYPPAWFRLKILLTLAQSRFQAEDPEAKAAICREMERDKQLIYRLFDIPNTVRPELYSLFHFFRQFLLTQFPREKYLTSNISSDALNRLIGDLEAGLPIPSVIDRDGVVERAATPAEILLAGWLHRCKEYKSDFLELVSKWQEAGGEDVLRLVTLLKAKVDRADECLKRSLQVVEWFRILEKSAKEDKSPIRTPISDVLSSEDTDAANSTVPGLLSDLQLKRLLGNGELRIIPLIDAEHQVSGSVIDVRLGHNFEIFFSNVQGAIDPLVVRDEDDPDSMEMDVDFLKSISVGPGQFLLAHTLEYIKLPSGIAAQIEGRSSFARLGLQVHMTANLVEAGFDGCLTLEISNCGHSTIKLYPGMRIAQLRFFRLVSPPVSPYGARIENKYRGLLSHNKTQQFSDWEVRAFQNAGKKFVP